MEANKNFDSEFKGTELGEAISYWIEKKGWLNLDTSEEEIFNFYKEKNEH